MCVCVTYTNDILGRTTQASYTGGLSDSFEYTPEGWLSALSNQDFTYDSIGNLTSWSDGAGNAQALTYNSSIGSSVLGLPSAITGTGNLSSYGMTYTSRNWLYTFTDTNKSKTFTYTWNSDKTLAAMQYPNQTTVTQTWYQKMLDTVTVTKGENTYLDIDSTFNNLDKITSYEYSVYAGQGQTFSESYSMEYDNLNRISELTFGSNNKELTYAYDQSVGKLTSITDSLLNDSYDFSYDSKERMDYITYPGVQGTVSFTYDDLNDKGRLEQVTYPGNKTMTFLWDSRDRITSIVLDDTIKEIEYALEYNDAGKIKRILHYEDDILIRTWNASYGLYGLEKIVTKDSLDQTILTQDFTTDPNGTILSMTYTPTQGFGGSFTGEAYHYYDPCTDTMVLADSNGDPKASYAISRSSGHVDNSWNPDGIIDIVAIGGGKGPSYTVPGFGEKEITLPWQPQPGYNIALIDAEFAIDIGITGATASTSTSDCGKAGTCNYGYSCGELEKMISFELESIEYWKNQKTNVIVYGYYIERDYDGKIGKKVTIEDYIEKYGGSRWEGSELQLKIFEDQCSFYIPLFPNLPAGIPSIHIKIVSQDCVERKKAVWRMLQTCNGTISIHEDFKNEYCGYYCDGLCNGPNNPDGKRNIADSCGCPRHE